MENESFYVPITNVLCKGAYDCIPLRCIYTIIGTMQVSIDHAMGSRENISEPIAQILQDNERRHFLVQSKVLPAKKMWLQVQLGLEPRTSRV